MNVRGWGVGKCDDLYEEMRTHEVTVMGVVETQMREKLKVENDEYVMIGKLRFKASQERRWCWCNSKEEQRSRNGRAGKWK